MKKYLAILFAAITALNSFAAVKIETGKVCGLETRTIENKFFKLTVIPDACGRISSLFIKDKGYEMLFNYSEVRRQEDPLLPEMVFSNNGGIKEWFWQKRWNNIPDSKMTVTDCTASSEQAQIKLFSKGYMSSPIQVSKKLSVEENSLNIRLDISLKNAGNKNEKFALWINSIPEVDTTCDYSLIPVAGSTPIVNNRATLSGEEKQLWRFDFSKSSDKFIAPGANWSALYIKKINTMMLISIPNSKNLIPGGMFYMWRGRIQGKEVITQEIIFPPLSLAPEQGKKYTVDLMIFPDMPEINALSGDTSLYVKTKNGEISITANSTKPHEKRILKVISINNESREIELPAMAPGKTVMVKSKVSFAEKGELRYFLDNKEVYVIPERQ
jgi:hypothetical protein